MPQSAGQLHLAAGEKSKCEQDGSHGLFPPDLGSAILSHCCNGLQGASHQGSPTFSGRALGARGGACCRGSGERAPHVTYGASLPRLTAALHSSVVFLLVSFQMEKCIRYIASHLWLAFHSLNSVFVRAVLNSHSPTYLFFHGWCCWWHMTSLTVTVDLCISPAVLSIFASNILTLWY